MGEKPDLAKILESHAAAAEEAGRKWPISRAKWSKQDKFCPLALGDWLSLCDRAGVPRVPALILGTADVDDLLAYDTPEIAANTEPFYTAIAEKMKLLGTGWMARWDCCSMAAIKWKLAEGEPHWVPEFAELYAADLRAFDLIAEHPRDRISAWARPWTAFAIEASYPIEYRAFVVDNEIIGVSNYYPQRPLAETEDTQADIARVLAFTKILIDAQHKEILCPKLEGFDLSKNHWSADFARLPSGAILFLEGGPPHTLGGGAHMCCFKPGEIDGIALSDRNGDQP